MQNNSDEKNLQRFTKELIFTKHIDWSYEQEWRVVGSKGIAIYSPDNIDRIIFGVKMPAEEKNTIRYILNNKKITFFQAVKSRRHFAIDIVRLD